ncbi:MAG: DUF4240 domain-containing protein [Candidatus Auribacterota bacterium]
MNDDVFWTLINDSSKKSNHDQSRQYEILKTSLMNLNPREILAFERILRKKIIECDNYKILAASKIINDYVTDDSYLYFRAWLIAKGRIVFENALEDPDSLAIHITKNEIADFEDLLFIATEAYNDHPNNKEDNVDNLGSLVSDKLDYDFNPPPTKGEDWTEEDLPKICPKLCKKFDWK